MKILYSESPSDNSQLTSQISDSNIAMLVQAVPSVRRLRVPATNSFAFPHDCTETSPQICLTTRCRTIPYVRLSLLLYSTGSASETSAFHVRVLLLLLHFLSVSLIPNKMESSHRTSVKTRSCKLKPAANRVSPLLYSLFICKQGLQEYTHVRRMRFVGHVHCLYCTNIPSPPIIIPCILPQRALSVARVVQQKSCHHMCVSSTSYSTSDTTDIKPTLPEAIDAVLTHSRLTCLFP